MTLIDKINAFESAPVSNVKLFNEIFTDTPLIGAAYDAEVEIGEITDNETTRWLFIGSLTVKHQFCKATGVKYEFVEETENSEEF